MPDQYIRDYIKRVNKEDKNLIFILMVSFIILFPISMKEIKVHEEVAVEKHEEEGHNYSISNIFETLNLYGDTEEGNFTYDKFEIISDNYLPLINKLELFKLEDVKYLENGKFKVIVERE